MKILTKIILAVSAMGIVSYVLAADPLVGDYQTYEDGQPKATVQIMQKGDVFIGKIIAGNTEKAKKYVGRTVITNLKTNGDGKYHGGTIVDPATNKKYKLQANLKGSTLKLRGYVGVSAFGRTQTWEKK